MTEAQIDQLLALDGEPGPALPISAADADVLIDAALLGAGFGPAGGPSSSGPAGGGARAAGRSIGGFKIAGATIAIAVAVVVIAILVGRRGRAHEVIVLPDAAPDAAVAGAGSGTPPMDASSAPPLDAPTPPTTDEPASTEDPAPPRPHKPAESHKAAEARAVNDLLGEANAKRAAHEWRESDALYARVVKRAPGTLGAQTALVASASLHLEHLGDPRGAAERYRRALAIAPDAAMAEEARWGLAEAARARGDKAGEAKALDDFLAHHPDSPLAPKARTRRSELK